LHDATTNPDVLRQWWRTWPDANIGLRTGIAFDVLDADDPADLWKIPDQGQESHGPVVLTGKGSHCWFLPTGHGNRTRLGGLALDWRGLGGYVLAPPSVHPNGAVYTFADGYGPDVPLETAPAAVLEPLDPKPAATAPPPTAGPAHHTTRGWSAAGLIGRLAGAAEGERNSTLYWAASRIVSDAGSGRVGVDDADAALRALHRAAVRTGLTETEIDRTIRSALAGRPR